MSFEINKYKLIKSVIKKDFCKFIYDYFLLKRKVADSLFKTKYISPYSFEWGTWKDGQVDGVYSCYADCLSEILLLNLKSLIEKHSGLELYPNYSYMRIYEKGSVLERHIDRKSCEISCTLNIYSDKKWPIFFKKKEEISINLNPGDMILYRGNELEHWRDSFTGENCVQIFLHYNNAKTTDKKNMFDNRPHLGLPEDFVKYE